MPKANKVNTAATVGAEVQVTMHIGDASKNEYLRFRATVEGVEAGDSETLAERLKQCRETLAEVFDVAEEIIEKKVQTHLQR